MRFNTYIGIHATGVHVFSLRFRMLSAISQRSWWLGLSATSGVVSSTLAASRRAFCWSKCCVVSFFPWAGRQAIFMACLRRGPFTIVFFSVCVCLRFFCFCFSSKKQVPMVNPQDWLKGTKWDGMPYRVTLGHPAWWVASEQVEVRSFFPLGLRHFLDFDCYFLLQALAAEISGHRFRTKLRKWSQARAYFFVLFLLASALVCMRVCVCECVLC